jgi:hypothetical protein
MVIESIDPYSITVTLDVLQAAATLQMLHMALNMGMEEDVAFRLGALGTEISPDSVVLQLGQVVDSLSRAIQMDTYDECTCGDKVCEPEYEADPDAPKPSKETVH